MYYFFLSKALIHHYRDTRILSHAKWSNLQNTQPNSTKVSAMLGEDEKNDPKQISRKNFE